MFVLQNIRDFIDNPMGKGSNAIPSRQLIKSDLKRRLDIMTAEKEIKITTYKNGNDYYIHAIIPSENLKRNNTYDVVLLFSPPEEAVVAEKNLNNYTVRFFSNSPSFTYTYAYSFNLYGLFIEELADKFEEETFSNPPVTRNPAEVISYEKSIFFACSKILDNHLRYLSKSVIDLTAKKYNKKDFAAKIRDIKTIKLAVDRETKRVAAEAKEAKEKEDPKKTKSLRDTGTGKKIIGSVSDLKKGSTGRITPTTAKGKITSKKSTTVKTKR